jgi:CRP/FNR family cyclic AMP-dependent transcriptional regulator
MASETSVRLLEVEPDLLRYLSDDERAEARRLRVPVKVVAPGALDLSELLGSHGHFGALVLAGLVVQRLGIAGNVAMRLIGPGDLLAPAGPRAPSLLASSACHAAVETNLAMLGDEMLAATRRWPGLLAGLHVRQAEQAERIAAQVTICQLPRVTDRVLAMLWLLAESWGRVTPAGVSLPLAVTHDALGALVGARRSTVTLAVGELVERGAVVRQDRGWLLLEQLPEVEAEPSLPDAPELSIDSPSAWVARAEAPEFPVSSHEELHATVARMRVEFEQRREDLKQRLARARRTRDSVAERRERLSH